MERTEKRQGIRYGLVFAGLAAALLALILLNICVGSVSVPLKEIFRVLGSSVRDDTDMLVGILWKIRLPRMVSVAFLGGALALAGFLLQTFFENLGLLDTGRREGYLTNEGVDMEGFSRQGFRWDFLLYSCVPILVGFYYVAREKFNDNWYKLMLNTYILCNSFWALVNSSWLSNRIAFLSWFMYGFVVMYPLLRKEVVPNRQQKVAIALICNVAFTYLLWLLGRI